MEKNDAVIELSRKQIVFSKFSFSIFAIESGVVSSVHQRARAGVCVKSFCVFQRLLFIKITLDSTATFICTASSS